MDAPGPLRAVRSWEELEPDRSEERRVHEAVLTAVGELGYTTATVREIAGRAEIAEERFQRRFGGKERCFAAAYAEAAERLREELAAACEATPGWKAGFEAALAVLLRFVVERPPTARSLLIEVKAARGKAWEKHQETIELLTAAVGAAREEPGARPNASPMTAGFVVGAIEESLCIEIAAGRAAEAERLHPDLTHLAFLQLFGEDEGR
jgi:AcrR family transcriptional regulator